MGLERPKQAGQPRAAEREDHRGQAHRAAEARGHGGQPARWHTEACGQRVPRLGDAGRLQGGGGRPDVQRVHGLFARQERPVHSGRRLLRHGACGVRGEHGRLGPQLHPWTRRGGAAEDQAEASALGQQPPAARGGRAPVDVGAVPAREGVRPVHRQAAPLRAADHGAGVALLQVHSEGNDAHCDRSVGDRRRPQLEGEAEREDRPAGGAPIEGVAALQGQRRFQSERQWAERRR